MKAVREKSSRSWRKSWTGWSCVTCLENQKLHRQRKNGNRQEKNIWTGRECRRVSVGNSSLMIRTGECHTPVNNRQGRKGVLRMLKQPERESRNVNDFFYEMEGRQLQKMNKVLAGVELTKAEERTLIWLAGWEESTVDHLLSVIEKVARIRADKKGGYAHK